MKVLKIGATWCPECVTMRPMWEEIESEMPQLETEYYEADDNADMLNKYQIENIPTFIFLDKDGEEISRLSGLQSKDHLKEKINEWWDK